MASAAAGAVQPPLAVVVVHLDVLVDALQASLQSIERNLLFKLAHLNELGPDEIARVRAVPSMRRGAR